MWTAAPRRVRKLCPIAWKRARRRRPGRSLTSPDRVGQTIPWADHVPPVAEEYISYFKGAHHYWKYFTIFPGALTSLCFPTTLWADHFLVRQNNHKGIRGFSCEALRGALQRRGLSLVKVLAELDPEMPGPRSVHLVLFAGCVCSWRRTDCTFVILFHSCFGGKVVGKSKSIFGVPPMLNQLDSAVSLGAADTFGHQRIPILALSTRRSKPPRETLD